MCKKISIYIKSGQYILQLNSDLHPAFTYLLLNPWSRFEDFNAWSGNIELGIPIYTCRYRFHRSIHPYIHFRIPLWGGGIDLFYSFISPLIQLLVENVGLVRSGIFRVETGYSLQAFLNPADFYKTRNIFTRKVQSRNIPGKEPGYICLYQKCTEESNRSFLSKTIVHLLRKQRYEDLCMFNNVFVLHC